MSLDRFHVAQADPHSGYEVALGEMRRGRKLSHWMWYIFPQLAGLGSSAMAQRYAIRDRAEARDYLRDPILSARYLEIGSVVRDRLREKIPPATLMSSRLDALKLISSMTLFNLAANDRRASDDKFTNVSNLCEFVIQTSGYPPCKETMKLFATD